ncbi:MAG: pyridoxal phosphate-dependent aminotransferase [Streptococcaceae bacterium]|nr:pyridoxal phosphate-dependent aminotransferase [Streptococcaceae bacterium]
MKKISEFVSEIEESVTLSASKRARALKNEGIDIIDLTLGQPDFQTPKAIGDAAITAIKDGRASFYTQATGLPELKKAIADYFRRYYGYVPAPDEILATSGAKFALYAYFLALIDSGDEVLIPAPYWVSYVEQVKMAGGVPAIVRTSEAGHFKVSVDQLEAARTDKTRILVLNSPSNPTGIIYTRAELTALGNWAVAHDIEILADDIYHQLVYNGATFTPLSSLGAAIRAKTTVIGGVSKTYSMTGWRIGLAVGSPEIISAMGKIASQTTSNPTSVSQYAAIQAFRTADVDIEPFRAAFEERLNTIYPLLATISGFEVVKPDGAFYFFVNVRKAMRLTGFTDVTAFSDALLEKAHVAVVTGAGFGSSEHIRLSYATDLESLKKAIGRIKKFIESN